MFVFFLSKQNSYIDMKICHRSISFINRFVLCFYYVSRRFGGVAVITSALHAEGREFEPRSNLSLFARILRSFYAPSDVKCNVCFFFLIF